MCGVEEAAAGMQGWWWLWCYRTLSGTLIRHDEFYELSLSGLLQVVLS